ncbi:MAG: Ldh family oxidoreductase [Armatimonadetes bacterium]|nr:Ldh family oxidoreductase [Armatimonadota bacterium]
MPTVSHEELLSFATEIVRAMGTSADEAEVIARSLVDANLAGHDSHGVIRLEQYAQMVRVGAIILGGPVTVIKETPATALLDGGWNFGQLVARRAMDVALRKARQWGVSTVSVRNSNHLGRLGEYTLLAAKAEMIGIGCVNNHGHGNIVAPFGGMDGRLATNPISIASPGPERPLLLDITTSVVAEGKVRVKRNVGERVPLGWLINYRGEPTTDPNDLYTDPPGAILPLGGEVAHKGYGLAVMVDVLAGALSGAGCSQSATARPGNATFFTVVDIGKFVPLEEFRRHVEVLINHVRASPLAPGGREILMPGEVEFREEERRRREGIPIDPETWRQLVECARELGVAAPAVT